MAFWLTVVAAMNLPFGPEKDELRFLQIREAMDSIHRDKRPSQLPLFQAIVPQLKQSLRQMQVELPGEASDEQEIFDYISGRGFCAREGRRISMCRFMASVQAACHNLPKWWVDAYECVSLSLE